LPGRVDGKRPLILEIHGGPHALYGNAFFHEFQTLAAQGYHVLYTNPRGKQGIRRAVLLGIAGGWGNLDYQDLMAAVDLIVQRPEVDADRLGVAGGRVTAGYMTNWIVGHTDRFKAAITMRCLLELHLVLRHQRHRALVRRARAAGIAARSARTVLGALPRWLYVEKVTNPILILHSEQDLRCPQEQAEQWFVSLRRLGKTAEFVRFPEESALDPLSPEWPARTDASCGCSGSWRWFGRYLKP